jgi:hypothetical protein
MSKPALALKIPPGYEKQYISTAPSRSGDGYIKQRVLEQWLKDNAQKVGSDWDFAVRDLASPEVLILMKRQICEGVIVLCVKIGRQLSDVSGNVTQLE